MTGSSNERRGDGRNLTTDDVSLRRMIAPLRLVAALGLTISLGGGLPPLWPWLLLLVGLQVVDAFLRAPWWRPWDPERTKGWLRLHGYPIWLTAIVLLGVCVRLAGIGLDLGHTPVDVDEHRLARTVLRFFETGEIDHSTVESYPGILFWLLVASDLLVYLAALMQGVAHDLASVPFERFLLAGRVTNVMLEACTIVFAGLLGRKLGGRGAGLAAALVVAVTPLSMEISRELRNEAAQALLVVASVWAAVVLAGATADATPDGQPRRSMLAAVAGGLAGAATAVKYSSVFVLLPGLVASALPPVAASSATRSRWHEMRHVLFVVLAFLAVLATTNHFLWADFPNFVRELSTEVRMSGALHWSAQKNPQLYYSRILGTIGPGWALLVLSVGYAVWAMGARPREPLILVIFPLSYLWFMTQRPSQFPRWVYPLTPFVAVAGTAALWAVIDRVRHWPSRTGAVALSIAPWIASSLVLAVLAQPLWRGAIFLARHVATPTYVLAEAWLRAHAAAGDRVLAEEGWLDLKDTALRVNRVPHLGSVLNGGFYPLCYNDWVVVPKPDMGRVDTLKRLRLAETFIADPSYRGNVGFDFALYATPKIRASEETIDFLLDHDEARSYVETDWPLPEAGSVGRSLPAEGASVYLPPLRYAARLDVELEEEPPRDGEGAIVARAPAGSMAAPIVVDLEGEPLPAEKVTRSGARISWSSAPVAASVLGRGVTKLRLAPAAGTSTRIRVLRFALRR